VYPRGSSYLLHFVELKDFIVEDALDFTHLFFVRALRAGRLADTLPDKGLMRWMEGSAAKFVAEVAHSILVASAGENTAPFPVMELYPGIGVSFEYLKFLWESQDAITGHHTRIQLRYKACGPEASRRKFEVLHADDEYPCSYVVDQTCGVEYLRETNQEPGLAIYNHDQSLHHMEDPVITLEDFLAAALGPRLLTVRVSTTGEDQIRTTVKGRRLRLPTVRGVLEQCLRTAPTWYYRTIPDYDAGYFLPVAEASVGLLLAYTAGNNPGLPGFQELRR
jgi:hypothetical protein